jgi:CubicO group peptidase (beta-lactamase class C family)
MVGRSMSMSTTLATRRRFGRLTGLSLLALLLVALVAFRPDRAARVAAAVAAHTVCSAVFVSGIDSTSAAREHIGAIIGYPARAVSYTVDRAHGRVHASLRGLFAADARFTRGYGCRVEHAGDEPLTPEQASEATEPMPQIQATDPAIETALSQVFAESPASPKRVKAVLVVQDGQILAERYAPGITPRTPLLSYSVAKSFTNALLGILVRQGRLKVEQAVDAEEWQASEDPRRQLTIEDLLRMRSGLDAEETGSGFDPVSRMEFLEGDMAAFAARHPLKAAPRQTFEYTSANTLILNRLIGRLVGGGAAGLRAFAEHELFEPLDIHGVTLEFDGRGVFVGSTFLYASARDYAKFGELFLRDGLTPRGERLLPEGWARWSASSTLGSDYGAGFWTNNGGSRLAKLRAGAGFPADGFFASGFLGQRIYIVPSAHLVVVRLGLSTAPTFGIGDDIDLIAATIRARKVVPKQSE